MTELSNEHATTVGEPMIGALLRVPFLAVRAHLTRELATAGFGDIRPAHLAVLHYPGPHGRRPIDIAAGAQMSKQALNPLLNDLERAGYLERRPDATNSRARVVWLTRRGHELVAGIRRIIRDVEDAWASELGPARFAHLRSLLAELGQIATRHDGAAG